MTILDSDPLRPPLPPSLDTIREIDTMDTARSAEVVAKVRADLDSIPDAPGAGDPVSARALSAPSLGGLLGEFVADLNLTPADLVAAKDLPPKVLHAIVAMALRHAGLGG
jgi:hypothetical protein